MNMGSREWILAVADVLGEKFLGIERIDFRGQNASPKCQLGFTVPRYMGKAPPEVVAVSKFEGYRGLYRKNLGSRRDLSVILFVFYVESLFPTSELVESVAEELGLIRRPNSPRFHEEFWHPSLEPLSE